MKKPYAKLGVCLLAFLLLLTSCGYPPVSTNEISDAGRYLETNPYVEEAIATHFVCNLPKKEELANQNVYYYRYQCGLAGDPSFVIYLQQQFEQAAEFQAEVQKTHSASCRTLDFGDGRFLVVYDTTSEYLDRLYDDIILDGYSLTLEMFIIDEQTQCIEYLIAQQQDNASLLKYIDRFLTPDIIAALQETETSNA